MSQGTPPDVSQQWQEIKGIFQYWKTLSGIIFPAITALPIAGIFVELFWCPKYEKVEPVFASLLAVLTIAFLYYAFRESSEGSIQLWANRLVCTGFACLVIHIALFLYLIAYVDEERYLTGFTLSDKTRAALANKEITSTAPKALLTYFGYDSEDDIWDYRWLAMFSHFVSCLGTISLLAGGFFLFTLRSFVHDRVNQPAVQTGVPPSGS